MTGDSDWLAKMMKDVERYRRDLQSPRSKARESNEHMWRALAGGQLDDMLISRENTWKYLRHASWKLRLAAISILRTVWKPDEELAVMCKNMAFGDPHLQVRGTALFTLACCYRGTNDGRIGELLGRIVSDATQPDSFRESAYQGLFHLRGIRAFEIPMPRTYRFPEDVDWVFVESFRAGKEPKD